MARSVVCSREKEVLSMVAHAPLKVGDDGACI
jgi:hypothetical protein